MGDNSKKALYWARISGPLIQEAIDRLNVEDNGTSIPPDLEERVCKAIEDSGKSWDRAIGEIARRS